MQISVSNILGNAEIILILTLLPGYVLSQSFYFKTALYKEQSDLRLALLSTSIAVIFAPLILLLYLYLPTLAILSRIFEFFAQYDPAQYIIGYLLLILSSGLTGYLCGFYYNRKYSMRYGAKRWDKPTWEFANYYTYRSTVKVIVDEKEIWGQIRYWGELLDKDRDKRDLLVTHPRSIEIVNGVKNIEPLGKNIYINDTDLNTVYFQTPLEISDLSFKDRSVILDTFNRIKNHLNESSRDQAEIEIESDDLKHRNHRKFVQGILRNRSDKEISWIEVKVEFLNPSYERIMVNHVNVTTISPNERKAFTIPYPGDPSDPITAYRLYCRPRRVVILETPKLRKRESEAYVSGVLQNVYGERLAYVEIKSKFFDRHNNVLFTSRDAIWDLANLEKYKFKVRYNGDETAKVERFTYVISCAWK